MDIDELKKMYTTTTSSKGTVLTESQFNEMCEKLWDREYNGHWIDASRYEAIQRMEEERRRRMDEERLRRMMHLKRRLSVTQLVLNVRRYRQEGELLSQATLNYYERKLAQQMEDSILGRSSRMSWESKASKPQVVNPIGYELLKKKFKDIGY